MKRILLALAALFFCTQAEAANRFWVGGTGTWDSTSTTHWAATSGGASGASAPTTGDNVTFDGSSGGGTVTVDTTVNGLSILSLTGGAFTGTVDFSVNNPSMTFTSNGTAVSFSGSGAGRIFKLGTGTFTLSNGGSFDFGTTTGIGTQSLASATIVLSSTAYATSQSFAGGGQTYGTLSVTGRATGQGVGISGNNTFSSLIIAGPATVSGAVTTQTITTALTVSGSSSAYSFLGAATTANQTLTLTITGATVTLDRCAFRNANFSGAVTATNSIDLGDNTNMTITTPSGGGGRIIGG